MNDSQATAVASARAGHMSARRTAGETATEPAQGGLPVSGSRPARASAPWWRRAFAAETPARLRSLVVVAGVLVVAVSSVLVVECGRARNGITEIGERRAPVVTAAADLYFAFNDMDAQVANMLLVGDATDLGINRDQAYAVYERRRLQADAGVQQLAAAGIDGDDTTAIRELLDGLGRYQGLAAETLLLKRQGDDAAALAQYRSATDLLRQVLLPSAQKLVDRHTQRLQAQYRVEQQRIVRTRIVGGGVGLLSIVMLLLVQMFLNRRYRRLLNPAIATATLLAAGIAVGGVLAIGDHADRLRTAKQDAFDSIMVLTRARAISYDANADESRYLLDSARATEYQNAFLDKSQQVFALDGATLATYDKRFDTAWRAYRDDRREIGWGGALGAEFRNITFAGERATAERTVASYQSYQADDRRIRQLVSAGRRDAAIALCTSYAPGGSNYAFERYDAALSDLIDINNRAFGLAVRSDQRSLRWWVLAPCVGALAVLTLLWIGVRPRLAEYR